MTKLDFFWQSKEEWYHMDENCNFVVNADAPEEAKQSYNNYLNQIKEKSNTGVL